MSRPNFRTDHRQIPAAPVKEPEPLVDATNVESVVKAEAEAFLQKAIDKELLQAHTPEKAVAQKILDDNKK